ncbi:MAG: WYL domain-containing protein [Pseudomonadota bacterium]
MRRGILTLAAMFCFGSMPLSAQSEFETPLCEAAEQGQTIALVYDKDVSKGCAPRIVDVHQVGLGKNGQLYLHGWQSRGCTKGRDFEAKRIFRFDKIKEVTVIEPVFGDKSQTAKAEGWDGCIGNNCFIERMVCE